MKLRPAGLNGDFRDCIVGDDDTFGDCVLPDAFGVCPATDCFAVRVFVIVLPGRCFVVPATPTNKIYFNTITSV